MVKDFPIPYLVFVKLTELTLMFAADGLSEDFLMDFLIYMQWVIIFFQRQQIN